MLDLKELSNQYLKLEQSTTTARELYATLLKRMHETDVVKGVQLPEASLRRSGTRPMVAVASAKLPATAPPLNRPFSVRPPAP